MAGRHEDVGHEPEDPRDEFYGPVLRDPAKASRASRASVSGKASDTGVPGQGPDRRRRGFRTGLTESFQNRESALNLRIAFASFGLVISAGLAVLALWAGLPWPAAALGLVAVIAAVNLVVVVRRRIRRGDGHPLFG